MKYDAPQLLEEYRLKGSLTDCSRRKLVSSSINLLRKTFGNYPTREEKIQLAKAIIDLFPSYKIDDSETGGIVRKIYYSTSKSFNIL